VDNKVKAMSLKLICLPVQPLLERVEAELAAQTLSDTSLISEAARYVLQNGGKRIRPALLLLMSKMLGASESAAVKLSAAVEMIHAASLMHDDVLDNASLRRGKPAANVKWGNQVSVLVGDFLWCKASLLAVSEKNEAIMGAMAGAAQATVEGEILEIVKSNDFGIGVEEYLKIITLKTARLFSCACEVAAIIAGVPDGVISLAKKFGLSLGVAFQLTDDVLDYDSSIERFGKRAGTDLCEGRITLPVINTLRACGDDEKKMIKEAILSSAAPEGRLKEIVSVMKKYNALSSALDLAKEYSLKAKEELMSFKPSLERDSLISIAQYSVTRDE